jgi:hypothetical protein
MRAIKTHALILSLVTLLFSAHHSNAQQVVPRDILGGWKLFITATSVAEDGSEQQYAYNATLSVRKRGKSAYSFMLSGRLPDRGAFSSVAIMQVNGQYKATLRAKGQRDSKDTGIWTATDSAISIASSDGTTNTFTLSAPRALLLSTKGNNGVSLSGTGKKIGR